MMNEALVSTATQQIPQTSKTPQLRQAVPGKRGLFSSCRKLGLTVSLTFSVALLGCGGPPPPPPKAIVVPTAPVPVVSFAPARIEFDASLYPAAPQRADGAIVIGLLLPMGDERQAIRNLAGHLYKAAQLALFDATAGTPQGGRDIILRLHDTKGTPQGATEAAKAALSAEVDFLVGPLFASSAEAIAPLLRGRDVKALAFSNDSRVADDNVWLMGFLPEQNIDRIVSEAIAQGLTRFGALLPQGPFGARIAAQFTAAVDRFGGTVVQTETYPPDAKDMFDPVKRLAQFDSRTAAHAAEMARLKQEAVALLDETETAELPRDENDALDTDAVFKALSRRAPELVSAYEGLKLTETLGDIPYDAVFMPEGGLALRNLAPLLPYFDIDPKRVKFIGTALWDDPALSQEPPLHGGWFAAPDGGNWQGFAERYETNYRRSPPRLAAMAYDAVALAGRLARMAPDGPFTRPLLTDMNGFAGIDGIIRLHPNGLNERGLAVREITRQQASTVSAAPASFVVHDRRLRSAEALAASLRQVNPDLLALPQNADDALENATMENAAMPISAAPLTSDAVGNVAGNPTVPNDQLPAIAPQASEPQTSEPQASDAQAGGASPLNPAAGGQ